MKKKIGIWLDHKKAILVFLSGKSQRVEVIESKTEQPARIPNNQPPEIKPEDFRERKYENQLGRYYKQITSRIHEAEAVLIVGPGSAKRELQQYVSKHKDIREQNIYLETTDKMSNRQVIAKTRNYFANTAVR